MNKKLLAVAVTVIVLVLVLGVVYWGYTAYFKQTTLTASQIHSDLVGTEISATGVPDWRVRSADEFLDSVAERFATKSQFRHMYQLFSVVRGPGDEKYGVEFTIEYQLQGLSWVLTDVAVDSAFPISPLVNFYEQSIPRRYLGYIGSCTVIPRFRYPESPFWSLQCDLPSYDWEWLKETLPEDLCRLVSSGPAYSRLEGVSIGMGLNPATFECDYLLTQ